MRLVGMNTHYRFMSLDYFLESMKTIGFDAIELWLVPHHILVNHPNEAIQKIKASSLEVVALCPEQNNPKPANLASTIPNIQKDTYEYFMKVFKIAKELDVKKIVVTPGWSELDKDTNKAHDALIKMLKKLCRQFEGDLVLESLQKFETTLGVTLKQIKKIVDEVNEPNLKVTLDLGAVEANGETVTEWFNELGPIIKHVHFNSDHSPFESENQLYEKLQMFKDNGYDGDLSLELVDRSIYQDPRKIDLKMMEYYQKGNRYGN